MFFKKKHIVSSESLSALAWKKLKEDRLAVFSMIIIGLTALIAILGYLITPDSTPFANEQFLELTTKRPGFTVKMLKIRKNEPSYHVNIFKKMLWGQKNDYTLLPISNFQIKKDSIEIELFTNASGETGEKKSFALADVVYALSSYNSEIKNIGKQIQFRNYDEQIQKVNIKEIQKQVIQKHIVTRRFLLGTDRYGRDMLSQLMIGARVSLSVGFISVAISLLIGILMGSLAGFFRGRTDDVIVWFINVVWSIPTLLLVIAISFALGKGFWQVFIAVGLTMWVEVARVVRGQIFSIREKEFVEAGFALGYKNMRIIFRHILPNVMSAVIVISAANFSSAILIEAGLSFLGIGVQPPMPSWGTMIKENYGYIILDSAYLAILPGLAIMLMVLCFMLIGNSLRDALDVKIQDKG